MGTKETTIEFSVKTSDGFFEANLSVPISYNMEEKEKAVQSWLSIIRVGLATSATEIRANLTPSEG